MPVLLSTVTDDDHSATLSPLRTTVCSALHDSPPVRYESSALSRPFDRATTTASREGRSEARGNPRSRTSSAEPRASVWSEPSSSRTSSHAPSAPSSVPSIERSPRSVTRTRLPRAFSSSPSPFATSYRYASRATRAEPSGESRTDEKSSRSGTPPRSTVSLGAEISSVRHSRTKPRSRV